MFFIRKYSFFITGVRCIPKIVFSYPTNSDNVKNIMISLNGKPIYNSGEKMYYIDESGNEIDVGRKWYLGEERYQYSLVEGNYDVELEYYEDVVSKLKISTTKDGENTTIGEYSVDSQFNDNINFSLTEIDSYDTVYSVEFLSLANSVSEID